MHFKQQEGIVRSFFTLFISVAASIPIKPWHFQELLGAGTPNVNHTHPYLHTLQVTIPDRGSLTEGTWHRLKGLQFPSRKSRAINLTLISLFISKASEHTAEVGQDCTQLAQSPKVSRQGTKPTQCEEFHPFFPCLPRPCETQNNPQEAEWTKVPLAHPGTEEFCIPAASWEAGGAEFVWAGLKRERKVPQKQHSPSLGAATSPPWSL